MSQIAEHPSRAPHDDVTEEELNRIRLSVHARLKAFYRMQSEVEDFMNPFVAWTKPTTPPFICYILWCMGELQSNDAKAMEIQTPELRLQYHCQGTWQEIVSVVMGLNPRWGAKVKRMWQQHQESSEGQSLSTLQFAKRLIEQKFHIR